MAGPAAYLWALCALGNDVGHNLGIGHSSRSIPAERSIGRNSWATPQALARPPAALRLAASAYPTSLPHTDRSSTMRLPPWRVPGVLFAALTAFVGCASDSTAPEPEPTFIGTWAGEAWSGDVAVSYGQQGDTMYISGSSPAGAGQSLSSIVTIRILYSGAGTYILGPSDATVTHLVGGDGVVSRHGTFSEHAGVVTLVGRVGDRVAGAVYFDARDVRDSAPNPTPLRFEGTFEANLPR